MKYMILILLIFLSHSSHASSCDNNKLAKLNDQFYSSRHSNNKEIITLTKELETSGKIYKPWNFIYKLEENDPEVKPIHTEVKKESLNLLNHISSQNCEKIIDTYSKIITLESQKSEIIIRILKNIKQH